MNDRGTAPDARRLFAFVVAAVLLIAVGIMFIPLSKKSVTSSAPSAMPPATTGVAPKIQ